MTALQTITGKHVSGSCPQDQVSRPTHHHPPPLLPRQSSHLHLHEKKTKQM